MGFTALGRQLDFKARGLHCTLPGTAEASKTAHGALNAWPGRKQALPLQLSLDGLEERVFAFVLQREI